MNIEEALSNKLAKEISDEIDREILWELLIGMGWHRVEIGRQQDNNHAVDITCWLMENIKHHYKRNGRDFLFLDERDATLFILRWV